MSDFLEPGDERGADDEAEHLRDDVHEDARDEVDSGKEAGEPGLGQEGNLGLTAPD